MDENEMVVACPYEIREAKTVEEIDFGAKCFWRISDCVYNEAKALRHSLLAKAFPPKTPLDYRIASQYKADKRTAALDMGTACHLAVFQPDEFESRIALSPDINKRTKAGKEEHAAFEAESAGKIIIDKADLDTCFYIRDAMYRHPLGRMLEAKKGIAELSGFFKWRDTLCKFRADYLVPDKRIIFDLKTTTAGHDFAFRSSVTDYNYHTAALFYMNGASQITCRDFVTWIWIVVEKTMPFKIYLYQPEKRWLEVAERRIDDAVKLIEQCNEVGDWPGPSLNVETLFVPAWMNNDNN